MAGKKDNNKKKKAAPRKKDHIPKADFKRLYAAAEEAKEKNKGGRPRKHDWDMITEMLHQFALFCVKKDKLPVLKRFCWEYNIKAEEFGYPELTYDTLLQRQKLDKEKAGDDGKLSRLCQSIKRVRDAKEMMCEEAIYDPWRKNVAGPIFILKQLGWSDSSGAKEAGEEFGMGLAEIMKKEMRQERQKQAKAKGKKKKK